MDWKIFFLLLLVLSIAVSEESDDDSDDNYYDVKKFHIQGRQVGDTPHCVVTRRRRSIQTNRKKNNDSPTLTTQTVNGSPLEIVTGHQMVDNPTAIPTGNIPTTSPTGTGIISPTGTDTGTPTGDSRPGITVPTATATATDTATDTASPTTYPTYESTSPDRDTGTKDKYNKKYKKVRDNKRISKIKDQSIENIGTGVNMKTKTNTRTRTGTHSATVTTTKTDAGQHGDPTINCIIVKRPTTPAPNPGLFGNLNPGIFGNFNLFNLRRRRSLRHIRRKFRLD